MDISKIKVDELKLSDIIIDFSKGKIRIPRFQRDYVWDRPRVVKLLNSIYKEYPIGTFFFWEAPAEYIHLYRNIPDLKIPEPDPNKPFNFILDGQQRITSLYVAIKGLALNIEGTRSTARRIDYSEISFDLDKEEFVIKKQDNERFVSLSSILDDQHLSLFKSLTDDRSNSFNKCYKKFSSYPLSVVYVRNQTLTEACEIFERINQGGIKLSIFDLVVASTWSNDFDLKEEVIKINKKFVESGFGSIPPETVLQTVSLLVKGQATRQAELQLTADDIKSVWEKVVKSLQLTIDYLSSNLGVKIIEFIPFISMIPMISYLYAKIDNRSLTDLQRKFVDEWFWKCAFSQRYNSSTTSLMGEDRRNLFDPLLKGGDITIDYPVTITAKDLIETRMYRYTSLRNGVLCILSQLNPKHLKNGGNFRLERNFLSDYNSPERHHIFPKSYLKKSNIGNENSIVNFCFIPAELNKEISDESPSEYISDLKKENPYFAKTLQTHLISSGSDSAVWINNYEAFLTDRSNLILKEIEKRIGKITSIEIQLQEEPEVVLNSLEEGLRIVIDMNLQSKFGENYWKQAIPGDIQDNIKERIKENSDKYSGKGFLTDVEKLTFCDLNDYRKIITKYWNLFEDEFNSLGVFERNFIHFQDYRNAIKHVREISSVQKKQGEGSVEWFINNIKQATELQNSE